MNGTKLEGIIGHFGTTSVLVELEDLILQGEEKSNVISFEAADFFRIIYKVKEELKAIEKTNSSEAMERLDYIEYKLGDLRLECERTKTHRCDDLFIQKHVFTTIKQALLKDQELEKENAELKETLRIIFEKRVNVDLFWNDFVDNGFGYHYYLEKWYKYQSTDRQRLTEEEFELLKRWSKNVENKG